MTTFNTEFREAIQALEWSDKQMNEVPGASNKQIVKGKERNCCIQCGFCPTSFADMLKSFLIQHEELPAREIKELTQ